MLPELASSHRFTTWRRLAATLAILFLGLTAGTLPATAQEQTGNLYGTALTPEGGAIPGVRVELTGVGAPRIVFTGPDGRFRFLNLDPGTYHLTASLEGFATVERGGIDIGVGRSTSLEVQMPPAIEDIIEVTTESPLIDERKIAKGATISQIELEKIPTARDPWAIVTQTPGVLSDRINVGGNESGQQAVFTAPAASDDENSFAVDGVLITDMAAIGSSPTYYDFDQFEEIQVSTGGSDIEKVAAGASLNLVTKRGSNDPRGSARYLLVEDEEQLGLFEQADPDIQDELCDESDPACVQDQTLEGTPGNSINEVVDFGFEAGGPVVRDRLWVWGSYGRNDIKQFAQNGDPDNTLLENSAVKLNGQPASANSIVGSWNRGDKIKEGRRPGSNFALEATWDQSGPTEIWKLEDTQLVSSDLYLTGLFSYVDGGFQLIPKGAPRGVEIPVTEEPLLDTDGVWQNTYRQVENDRNTDNYQVDGSYFFTTGDLGHELKFGLSHRKFESISRQGYPGRGIAHLTCEGFGTCGLVSVLDIPGDDAILIVTQAEAPVEADYTGLWLQDTLTTGAWTLNGGLRYDLQEGENLGASIGGIPAVGRFFPAKRFDGNDPGFDWETVSPRVGVTYALGAERRTLLRASYSRFAEQLETSDIDHVNPLGFTFAYLWYGDANGNDFFDDGEATELLVASGFDPNDPGALSTPNEIDPSFDPTLTDEVVLGVERALLPEFVVGVDVTWRNVSDVGVLRPLIIDRDGVKRVATRDDYELVRTRFSGQDVDGDGEADVPFLPDGSAWSADFYGYAPGITASGGTLQTNGDSERDYLGASLNFTKRLSNRWMARGYFQYGEAEWDVGDEDRFFENPTDEQGGQTGFDGTAADSDSGLYVVQSAGSGPFENVFIQSTWSANLNGMYQVAPDRPWGFNVAGNAFAREGYPLLYAWTEQLPQGLGSVSAAATPEVDSFRADDVYTFDLRLEKDMQFTDNLSGILSLDAFNVTNENHIMGREVDLESPQSNFVTQTLSPRIYRLGFRLNWR